LWWTPSGTEWKNAKHQVDRTANWCIGGCWFTLAHKLPVGHSELAPNITPSTGCPLWPEWTSNHQCTSWPFCPLDALRFFIRRQMGFIVVHFFLLLTTVLFFFGSWPFFLGPNLTHSYLAHFFTLIGIATTLVPYLLFLTNTATLITNYPIDLATVLTTYPTNLATLLITYPTNLTTILTT